jgi:hypothetical protein
MLLKILVSALLMVTGAAIDKLVDELGGRSIASLVEEVHERTVCPRNALLAEALGLRAQAIATRSEAMHMEANSKLERSANCGHLLAAAHLGLGVCRGYGQPADPRRGRAIIRDAYERGARLSPDFFALCRLPRR